MENIMNNMVENEEVIDVIAEEIAPQVDSGNVFEIFGKVGAAAVVGYVAYKGGKLIYDKIKEKKEEAEAVIESDIDAEQEDLVDESK